MPSIVIHPSCPALALVSAQGENLINLVNELINKGFYFTEKRRRSPAPEQNREKKSGKFFL